MSEYSSRRLQKIHAQLSAPADSSPSINTTANLESYFRKNTAVITNWANTFSCVPEYYHQPSSLDEIIDIVKFARERGRKVRVIGSGHSPSDIAMTTDHMISLSNYNKIIHIDKERAIVRTQAGIRLFELVEQLSAAGLQLKNLGSIMEQSLAGAISTGTHGTGVKFGILADEVIHVQFVNGEGDVIECSESHNKDIFDAIRCSFGALGIITEITIRCEPLQHLEYFQYPMRFEAVMRDFKKLANSAEHTRIWWFPHTDWCVVWQASRVEPKRKPTFTKFKQRALKLRDKLIGYYSLELLLYASSFAPSTVPMINKLYHKILHGRGRMGQDVSYKAFVFDCLFRQYVNEWAIPIENGVEGVRRLRNLIEQNGFKVHFPVEIRFVKGDDIWLSPAYGGDKCYIGIIMYRPYGKDIPYQQYFKEFEKAMSSLGGRPHWAKIHSWTAAECERAYPMFTKFLQLREAMDPNKVFWNDYLERVLK